MSAKKGSNAHGEETTKGTAISVFVVVGGFILLSYIALYGLYMARA